MNFNLIRLLRTVSSERFVLQTPQGDDAVAVDLHYARDGRVAGTVFVFDGGGITDEMIPDVLQYLDEVLLPDASLDEQNLSFTVVRGKVIGDFTPETDVASA